LPEFQRGFFTYITEDPENWTIDHDGSIQYRFQDGNRRTIGWVTALDAIEENLSTSAGNRLESCSMLPGALSPETRIGHSTSSEFKNPLVGMNADDLISPKKLNHSTVLLESTKREETLRLECNYMSHIGANGPFSFTWSPWVVSLLPRDCFLSTSIF